MIDPNEVSTIRLGQLANAALSLTDNIPHEVGTDLKRATLQEFSDFISAYIGASDGVGFRAVTVTDGQTLPVTTEQEFILVGKGTFYNQAGGSTLVLTEELNAIVSNGAFWFIGVEIPVNVELAGITQFIRSGFLTTTPSEDAIFNALASKVDIDGSNIFPVTDQVITVAATQTFTVPVDTKAFFVSINGAVQYKTTGNNLALTNRWSQTGDVVTLTKTTAINNYVYIISK